MKMFEARESEDEFLCEEILAPVTSQLVQARIWEELPFIKMD